MAATKKTSKSPKKAAKKPMVSKKEVEKLAASAKADMKKLGITNIKDYIDYIDKKRGY